jgi:hypothetical protein
MVAAYQLVAIDFALTQKRALMRAAPLERAPTSACANQRDIDAVRGQCEGTSDRANWRRAQKGRASCGFLQL